MNKLRLRLDELAVEGFSTTPAAPASGTVVGQQGTHYSYCTCNMPTCDPTCAYSCDDETCYGYFTCGWQQTCEATCLDTCGPSCYDTCPRDCGPYYPDEQ